MKNRGCQHRRRMPFGDAFDEVIQGADASGRDHRHRQRIGYGTGQPYVEAFLGAVPVHGRQQYFTGPQFGHALAPADGLDAGGFAAAVGENLVGIRAGGFGINRNDDALAAELFRRLTDKIGVFDRRRVDGDFIGAGQQQFSDVFDFPYPAAHGQRHETLFRRVINDVVNGVAIVRAGGDIEEAKLIRPGLIIDPGLFHRIAGIHQIDEINPLDDAAGVDIQTGNNSDLQHQFSNSTAAAKSMRPS